MTRNQSDWSIETGPVQYDNCQACGCDIENGTYCTTCKASGTAEAAHGVVIRGDARSDWE